MSVPTASGEVPAFAIGILVDSRGWVLIQQRGKDAAKQPLKWACIGGKVGGGETPLGAAGRELHQQAGVSLDASLTPWAVETFTWSHGPVNEYHVFVGPTALADADVHTDAGGQVVFVDPVIVPTLDFTESGAHVLGKFLRSEAHAATSAAAGSL